MVIAKTEVFEQTKVINQIGNLTLTGGILIMGLFFLPAKLLASISDVSGLCSMLSGGLELQCKRLTVRLQTG
ncbi:hypothetical protein [Pseudobacteriovorax antillogorgiicola]|uniref:hypothetical protein n=1 Tax=Pseudobacteriovorax antillogorgiicola TaxID=1513793 RepID=UPI00104F3C61|nr:hypothetical protein [Pseudobacteriovorax antillogorgiicola]